MKSGAMGNPAWRLGQESGVGWWAVWWGASLHESIGFKVQSATNHQHVFFFFFGFFSEICRNLGQSVLPLIA